MKLSRDAHTPRQKLETHYRVNPDIANKIRKLSGNSALSLGGGIFVREWRGEKAYRYALERRKGSQESFLILVSDRYEGQTFIVYKSLVEQSREESPAISTLKKRISSRFRDILPAMGIAAFLSFDICFLEKMLEQHVTEKITQSQPEMLQSPTEVKIPQIYEILAQNHLTIEDFVLSNPELFRSVDAPLDRLENVRIPAGVEYETSQAQVTEVGNPFDSLLLSGRSLEDLSHDVEIQRYIDEYHTVLETMIAVECAQKDGAIPKDIIGGSDVHKGEQYAGINMNSARNSGNPEKLLHAQEIAACHARGDQKTLRELVKTYYLLYYFPIIQSRHPAITASLLDVSMNRGANSLPPLCKMVINDMTGRNVSVVHEFETATDKEGNGFLRQKWDKEWTQEHQKMWDVLCLRNPNEVLQKIIQARKTYEDHTFGPRPSIRKALEKRWKKIADTSEEMFLPSTHRDISYHDSVALIEKSLTEFVPIHDATGKPIIYRVERIKNPNKNQVPGEKNYMSVVSKPRPKKEMLLFHGTASGIVGKSDERIRDLGGFNAVYGSSDAAYIITSRGLVFEFFDPTKGYGAANATRIAESTGIAKENCNLNEACVAAELCLRGYQGGPQEHVEDAIYGVESPTDVQKQSSRELVHYLQKKLHIRYVGTSADPVRDHTKCYNEKGEVLPGPKYLVPKAHCDDFPREDREEMGIMSAEEMAEIFSHQGKLSQVFGFDLLEKERVAMR